MIALGIDSGTQSTKTIALDLETGHDPRHRFAALRTHRRTAARSLEQEPQVWVDAVDATVREVLQKLGKRKDEVQAIGVSGQQHGFVPLDKKGKVIRPAKLWCDTSTVEQCKQFDDEFGGAHGLIKLAGNAMLPGYTAPKILWLKQNEPKNYKALETVLLPHDYINFHLTGERGMEYGDASGTGLLDVRTKTMVRAAHRLHRSRARRHAAAARQLPPRVRLAPREAPRSEWGLSKAKSSSARAAATT